MATRSITNPTINKISAAEYNTRVASGNITETMISDQVWLDTALTVPVQHKLVDIEAGAQVNKIEGIKANGVALTPDANKVVNIDCVGEANIINSIKKEGVALQIIDKAVNIVESDPTVPAWAKASSKPTYTYSEITGTPTIPTKTSDLTNDSGYLTSFTESDPSVPSWAKQPNKPAYSYSEITGTPSLAAVATSGSYNDLTDKPTIGSTTLVIWE